MAMSSERNERNAIGFHRIIRGIENFAAVMVSDWDQLDDAGKDAMRDFAQRIDMAVKGDFPPEPTEKEGEGGGGEEIPVARPAAKSKSMG